MFRRRPRCTTSSLDRRRRLWFLTRIPARIARYLSEDGSEFRLPGRTRFEQPQAKAEVTIRWLERDINPELSQDKFEMEIPPLPRCGE